MYKGGVGGWEGGGREGGDGRVGGSSEPETQAAKLSAQELTETVTVGLAEVDVGGLVMPSDTPTGS